MTTLGIIFIAGSIICGVGIIYILIKRKKEKHA
jgi:uncharacterized membrane-anchored protein YitT (DUF2179 family)